MAFRWRWAHVASRSARRSSTRSAPTGVRRSRCHSTSPTPTRSKDSCTRRPSSSATSRCWSPAPATPTSGKLHEIDTETFESQIQIHLIGANRLATAVLPGMVERRRGDLIFVGSDVALRQRPHMGAYGAAKAALVAMVTNLQMELEGTGVRASIVHPGPDEDGDGLEPARRADRPGAGGLGQVGSGAPRLLPAGGRSRPGDHVRRRDAPGRLRGRTWSFSPRRRWPRRQNASNSKVDEKALRFMTTAIVPRVSGGEEEHGHLEEFRTDPIGLMQRTRDECGDVGLVPAGRQARHPAVRRRAPTSSSSVPPTRISTRPRRTRS